MRWKICLVAEWQPTEKKNLNTRDGNMVLCKFRVTGAETAYHFFKFDIFFHEAVKVETEVCLSCDDINRAFLNLDFYGLVQQVQ